MRRMTPRPVVTVAVLAFALAVPRSSRASGAGDDAAAASLFVQAREAMGRGDYVKACPMLEESFRLVPGVGTQFNLADCYEKVGKAASAWALFLDVAAASRRAGQSERADVASERARRLEPELCRVILYVAAQENATITRDGRPVGVGQLGVAVPIDAGDHRVTAEAPGKRRWSHEFSTTTCPTTTTIDVPALAPGPLAANTGTPPPAVTRANSGRTALTVSAFGLGVAGAAFGTYFGIRAWSLRDASDGHCTGNRCDDEGRALRSSSLSSGTASTVAFVTGAVFLTIGTILWLTDSPASRTASASTTR